MGGAVDDFEPARFGRALERLFMEDRHGGACVQRRFAYTDVRRWSADCAEAAVVAAAAADEGRQ